MPKSLFCPLTRGIRSGPMGGCCLGTRHFAATTYDIVFRFLPISLVRRKQFTDRPAARSVRHPATELPKSPPAPKCRGWRTIRLYTIRVRESSSLLGHRQRSSWSPAGSDIIAQGQRSGAAAKRHPGLRGREKTSTPKGLHSLDNEYRTRNLGNGEKVSGTVVEELIWCWNASSAPPRPSREETTEQRFLTPFLVPSSGGQRRQ